MTERGRGADAIVKRRRLTEECLLLTRHDCERGRLIGQSSLNELGLLEIDHLLLQLSLELLHLYD